MSTTANPDRSEILEGALISGAINAINAVFNGAIQWYLLAGQGRLPLTVDRITNETTTVFGAAVPLAVSLAMVLSGAAFVTIKTPEQPFFPSYFRLVIKHGLFSLGTVARLAVVWQRVMRSVEVGLSSAVVLLGLVAGLVAVFVKYMTISASLDISA